MSCICQDPQRSFSNAPPEKFPELVIDHVDLIQSLAGALEGGAISRIRPFRNPHHSASMAALVGGGLKVKPGEVSLAHLGVLFLDELPEFPVLGSKLPKHSPPSIPIF